MLVAVDDDDRVIVAFNDWQRGKVVTLAYSESPDRDDWQLFDLTTENMGRWEPSLDLNRWKEDGVISLLYLPTMLGSNASVISILEWDAGAYFYALAPAPGDANRDGVVDETDAQSLAGHWGEENADWEMGDFNDDGTVDAADAAILAANWGYGTTEASGVPEPSTAVLLALSALLGLTLRRR